MSFFNVLHELQEFLQGCTSFPELLTRTEPYKVASMLFAWLLNHIAKLMEDQNSVIWERVQFFCISAFSFSFYSTVFL